MKKKIERHGELVERGLFEGENRRVVAEGGSMFAAAATRRLVQLLAGWKADRLLLAARRVSDEQTFR